MAHIDVRRGERGGYEALGFQQITSLSASTALTVPAGARAALLLCTGQPVRFKADTTAPTSTVGVRLAVNDTMLFEGDLQSLRFIEEGASAVLNVQYFR